MVALCTSSVVAPELVQRYQKCREDGGSEEECTPLALEAFQETDRRTQRYVQEISFTEMEKKGIKSCKWPPADQNQQDPAALECLAPILCPDQNTLMVDCLKKKNGEYGQCLSEGIQFGKCFGKKVVDSLYANLGD